MAKHQPYDYKQSVIEPIFLEDQLEPGTLEHAIHYIVEERLDMSVFDARYNNGVTGEKIDRSEIVVKNCALWLFTRNDLIAQFGICLSENNNSER